MKFHTSQPTLKSNPSPKGSLPPKISTLDKKSLGVGGVGLAILLKKNGLYHRAKKIREGDLTWLRK